MAGLIQLIFVNDPHPRLPLRNLHNIENFQHSNLGRLLRLQEPVPNLLLLLLVPLDIEQEFELGTQWNVTLDGGLELDGERDVELIRNLA